MVSAKRRDDSNKRQKEKRLLDVGTENEIIRKEEDKRRKKGKKNSRKKLSQFSYTCFRDILNKPPPRYGVSLIWLSLIYIGENKFADTNGEWIEIFYDGEKKLLSNCVENNIELYDSVGIGGQLLYEKNSENNAKFDYFYIVQPVTMSRIGLYAAAQPATLLYKDHLLLQGKLNASSFHPFTAFIDLNMCPNWKNRTNIFVGNTYKRLSGL